MTKEARQEIRRVLMGRTVPAEDGRLVALEKADTTERANSMQTVRLRFITSGGYREWSG